MAARSIASLTLGFGLVSIPVKLYSATESSASIRFNLLSKDGSRVRQQYISEKDGKVVERADMVKGYEFEKDKFVLFEPSELKALEEGSSHVVDIVAFVPEKSIDPIYYDKAYMLAPDKRGGKPYALLAEAMRKSGRCALARWSWKTKRYVVQVRPAEDGLMLQQLFFADEVRSLKDLNIEKVDVTQGELNLAMQLIDQIAEDGYDASAYHDEEKQRVLAAIDRKIAGQQIVAHEEVESPATGQVIDLMEALRASLGKRGVPAAAATAKAPAKAKPEASPEGALKERKGVRRAAPEPATAAPTRVRAKKEPQSPRERTFRASGPAPGLPLLPS
jgi:DNA end-binding protein Ku